MGRGGVEPLYPAESGIHPFKRKPRVAVRFSSNYPASVHATPFREERGSQRGLFRVSEVLPFEFARFPSQLLQHCQGAPTACHFPAGFPLSQGGRPGSVSIVSPSRFSAFAAPFRASAFATLPIRGFRIGLTSPPCCRRCPLRLGAFSETPNRIAWRRFYAAIGPLATKKRNPGFFRARVSNAPPNA